MHVTGASAAVSIASVGFLPGQGIVFDALAQPASNKANVSNGSSIFLAGPIPLG